MRLKKQLRNRKTERSIKSLLFYFLFLPFLGGIVFAGLYFLQLQTSFLQPVPEGAKAENITDDYQKVIKDLLRQHKIAYTKIQPREGGVYSIFLDESQEAIITIDRSLSQQVSSLQRISNRLTMEGKRFSRLDLRFEKAVIVLK